MKSKLNLILIVSALLFINFNELIAQRTIGAPVLQDFAACADITFNSFTVIAELNPGDPLPSDNEFILQLSDPNGSFDDPNEIQELARVVGPNNGSGSTLEIQFTDFAIPQNANSDTYKLRVISTTDPVIISELSDDTAMHFFRNDLDLFLNEREDVIFCNVSTFTKTLTIRLEDLDDNAVPADTFEWEWFKDGALIVGESSPSLVVNDVGRYFARIPLGNCQNFFTFEETNRVDVSLIDVSSVFIETPAPDFSFCPNEIKVLNSSEQSSAFDYQWIKDGVDIDGEISPTITLPDNEFAGDYEVRVTFSEDCELVAGPVTVVNEGSSITQALPENLILLPTQIIDLEIMTDAPDGSTVRWFVETSLQSQTLLSGGTSSFEAQFVGRYRVEIDALDPCNSFLFSETELFAPTGFDIVIGTEDENACAAETFTLELLEMTGQTVGGLDVPLTEEQLTFFDFEWFRNGVSTGDTTTSIEVSSSDIDAVYTLMADLRTGEFTGITSNDLAVSLIPQGTVILADPLVLTEGESVTLSVPQNDAYTYQWSRIVDGENIVLDGETNNTLIVTEQGEYFVTITSAICEVIVPPISIGTQGITEIIPNVITPNGDNVNDNWFLPASLVNQQDVEVTIYNRNGQVDFMGVSYQNNWPFENSKSSGQDPIYYYIITKNNSVLRKGSITVMR
ncbi:gliding motility-associated C-terminal domain-containing protein [Aquimarina sp. AU474]|uniref:T9SS type B sorting domain-containing protein n=1 Tax=Aquimarina sp. AU474 TaxID=2108529 RepID=UPI000D698948|nr:gliding motility-associated C-terminal domain-containing protein [Aquimarina sp. AU474]